MHDWSLRHSDDIRPTQLVGRGMTRLAVLAPHVGGLSETFIRRHMENLAPKRTVVVTASCDGFYGSHWTVDAPMLVTSRLRPPSRLTRWARRAASIFGMDHDVSRAAVVDFLQRHHVSVALGEYLDWSLPWLTAVRRAGIRFYAHAHGYDVSMRLRDPAWRSRYRAYNEADGVIVMSQAAKQRLVALGLREELVHVVPYGVDVPTTCPTRPSRPVVHCVAVGRMVAKKGPLVTLEAFRQAARGPVPLRLDYIGDGELLGPAERFVREHGLQSSVFLHRGQAPERVREHLLRADMFLQHSITDAATGDEEGLPVAVLEAMAHALPVVSTHHAGIPEAVVTGVTGLLVEQGDAAGMAECIVALARSADLRRDLGGAAWRRARAHFRWEQECGRLRALLRIHDLANRTCSDYDGPYSGVAVPAHQPHSALSRLRVRQSAAIASERVSRQGDV